MEFEIMKSQIRGWSGEVMECTATNDVIQNDIWTNKSSDADAVMLRVTLGPESVGRSTTAVTRGSDKGGGWRQAGADHDPLRVYACLRLCYSPS